jgi:FAD/FMN-containing dehydrogenase
VAGHVGNGNFHIIPLLDMHDLKNRDMILDISNQVYDLVLAYKGSITAEHNDGIVRTPYLEKMYGPFIAGLFKLTKTLFDPKNIFNPGKKVGDTKDYLKDHIRVEK